VVVSNKLGPNTVVLLSRVPNQPELLPVVSEVFRVQRVRILRGWMEAKDGDELDVFEVVDTKTNEPLIKEAVNRVERAIVQAVRAPFARQVLRDIDDQIPPLESFYGLPVNAPRAPPMSAARGALVGAPFRVSEATDLGRALIFRGELEEGVDVTGALDECQRRLCNISPADGGRAFDRKEWTTHLVTTKSGLLLVLLPIADLEEATGAKFDQRLLFFLGLGITVFYAQSSAPVSFDVLPPVGALVLSVVGTAEMARRGVAALSGLKLNPPVLLPSPAIGSFGACASPECWVPNAVVAFDLASAALFSAFAASLILIGLGLLMPPGEQSCAWANPRMFPYILRNLIAFSAEQHEQTCLAAPPGSIAGLVPTSPALIAGCFGALTTALNALPLGRLDGTSLALSVESAVVGDYLLPSGALFLLFTTMLDSNADSLFPVVLSFCFFTYGVRSQLIPMPVYRDNLSKPWDTLRRTFCIFLYTVAFALLTPSVIVDGIDGLMNPTAGG